MYRRHFYKRRVAICVLIPLLFPQLQIYAAVDPTMPMFLQKKTKPKKDAPKPRYKQLNLTSTLIAPGRSVAIINGKVVTVGDEVDAAVVLKITPANVVLRRAGKRIHLQVSQSNIKRQSMRQIADPIKEGN